MAKTEQDRADATSGSQPVSYTALLRIPGIPTAFVGACSGRLSFGMVSVSLLLTVQQATGSFAVAGAVLGGYSVANLTAPLKARALDRLGHTATLLTLGVPYGITLGVAAFCGLNGVSAAAPYLVTGTLAGLTAPPVGSAMRALWASVTDRPELRRRAYSLDVAVEATLEVSGPLLTGVLTAVVGPGAALLGTALTALVSCTVQALCGLGRRLARIVAEPGTSHPLGPLQRPGFVLVLLAIVSIGLAVGLISVGVAARTEAAGSTSAAGFVLAALSAGSALGGLLWGRLRHRRPLAQQLALTLLLFGLGTALAAFAPGSIGLAGVLVAAGLFIAPSLVSAYMIAESLALESQRSESTTWVNNSYNIGNGLGSAGAGLLVGGSWVGLVFLFGGGVVVALSVNTALVRNRLRVPHIDEN